MATSLFHCEPNAPGPVTSAGKTTGSKKAKSGVASGSKVSSAAVAVRVPAGTTAVTSTTPGACGGAVTTMSVDVTAAATVTSWPSIKTVSLVSASASCSRPVNSWLVN